MLWQMSEIKMHNSLRRFQNVTIDSLIYLMNELNSNECAGPDDQTIRPSDFLLMERSLGKSNRIFMHHPQGLSIYKGCYHLDAS